MLKRMVNITMFDFLMHPFMIRAILIGIILAISTSLISNYLVSSNQSLIGDGLAHISFTGVVIGVLFSNNPLYVAIPIAILASILIKFLMRSNKLHGDTAIGLVSSFALAIGFILISKSAGFNMSVESMLVGSIFSTKWSAVLYSGIILILVLIFILFSYQKLFTITFDSTYAKFSKIKEVYYDYALAALTAVVVVVGVQTIGTLLISAFVIFPAVLGSLIAKSFKHMMINSVIINVVVTIAGIIIGHFLSFPAGSTIIVLHGITFGVLYLFKWIRRIE